MSIAEKLTIAAENVQKVYDAGKKSEHDAFWDSFQTPTYNLSAQNYTAFFAGRGWTKDTFKPKFDIRPTTAIRMFYETFNLDIDMVSHLQSLGVIFDTSKSTSMQEAFMNCRMTHLGVIDVTSSTSNAKIFRSMVNLVTIDKLVLKSDGSSAFDECFTGCTALENLTIEGVIGKNYFKVSDCTKLSADSLASVINALSPTTTGLAVTLPTTAEANYNTIYGDGAWATLIATKPNWTIAYA